MPDKEQASDWTTRAGKVLPEGGFGNFDPSVVIQDGLGARVRDMNGKEYIDFLIGSGPLLLGHAHPEVTEAVYEQLPKGTTFFTVNSIAIELAEEIVRAVPCAEKVRYVSTGSEADMYAMRLARAATGRDKIVKFEGGYHGMSAEGLMSLAPTRLANFPEAVPDSGGIPEVLRGVMLIAPFNDISFVDSLIAEYGSDIAGIIVEPLQRIIPPRDGFLEALRERCTKHDIVLIFDEVVTGFRFSYGGAQEFYGVTPDLCTMGKLIGGGFPLAVVAGRTDIMDLFDKSSTEPERYLMQVGTLSGNPIAAVAGHKTLEILRRPNTYEKLFDLGQQVMDMIAKHLTKADIPHRLVGVPPLFDVLFTKSEVHNYRDVQAADKERYERFSRAIRKFGILRPPGKFYTCLALTDSDLEITDAAIEKGAAAVAS